MKIAIGNDHAGYQLKKNIIQKFSEISFNDFGTDSDESVDYPDFAHKVSNSLKDDTNIIGILICGSGNGIAMSANKHEHVRAAICWEPELASLARQHNDANILVLPARFIDNNKAFEILKAFLNNEFEGGRHARRRDKISFCN